jgi:membrane-bound lytic murein transglycosylase D
MAWLMVKRLAAQTLRRWFAVVASVPLVLLAGCPQQNAGAPGKTTAQQTAPALAGPATTKPGGAHATADTAAGTASQAAMSSPEDQEKVQLLLRQVTAKYQSGVANYRAQRLDAARMDFDAAVDQMLTSGMDLKGDPQLSDQFEQLINAVNSLEMQALKVGNGFSPKVEETPLDAVGELTFPPASAEATAALKAELKTTGDLPLVINPTVAGYINAFANSSNFRAHMVHSLERAGKYKEMILRILKEEGVPQDLFYLAVAESGFQPQVVNASSGAGGMWQFMPSASYYGLVRNGYFDERFDPEKSTRAYARYMKQIYNQLGDWYLAMAGYDWGPGNIQRAVMRTGYADFWELYRHNAMPAETKNYVPQILAAIIMAKNPERYGLDKLTPDAPVLTDTVTTDYAIDMRLVADLTNATVPEIVALNPALLRLQTPRDIRFDLHLPVGTRDVYLSRLKDIPEDKRISWRFHVVKEGETLDTIAASLHAHADDIREENEISMTSPIEPDDELIVPVTLAAAPSRAGTQHYAVRSGDTLVRIADRFDVSTDDLRLWNHLRSSTVPRGRTLVVSAPVRLARAELRRAVQRLTAKPLHDRVRTPLPRGHPLPESRQAKHRARSPASTRTAE